MASTAAATESPGFPAPDHGTKAKAARLEMDTKPHVARVIVRVELHDGQVLRGELTRESESEYEVALLGGGRITLPRRSVKKISVDQDSVQTASGEVWFADPNRTRYFYGPSAMMLRKGQAYFSQKELFFSAIGVGITDNFSFLVGTVAPAWLLGGFNAIIGLKAGGAITPEVHLAAGAETLVLPPFVLGGGGGGMGGFVFGSATYGQSDRHLTLSLGKPFSTSFSSGGSQTADAIATVSGSVRLGRNIGLITENWLVMNDFSRGSVFTAHAFGARLMGETIAADLGFIWVTHGGGGSQMQVLSAMPIPWVDFTWNFALGGG